MKRILLPILGIAILIVTVAQVHAMRRTSLSGAPAPSPAQKSHIVAEGRLDDEVRHVHRNFVGVSDACRCAGAGATHAVQTE